MNKFTPGPWHITKDTIPGEFVTLTKVRDRHGSVVAVMHVDADVNAKLISAAPELLAALQMVNKNWDVCDPVEGSPAYIVRQAIAKATTP